MTEITFATSIRTGQSIYKPYKAKMADQLDLIQFTLAFITENRLIDFDPAVKIHIKPIKCFFGQFDEQTNFVTLNCRNSPFEMIQTLLHELKHSEQSYNGRYRLQWDRKEKRWNTLWHGKRMEFDNWTTKQDVYENLPWEIEARSVEKYADMIWKAYR